jgi:FlaA1/EpsC-like NDP-sugar epimerase
MSDTTYTVLRLIGKWKDIWQGRLRLGAVCAEMSLAGIAFIAAIRAFEPSLGHVWARHVLDAAVYVLIIRFCTLLYFGTYKSMLRHAGITDAIRIGETVVLGSLVFAATSILWRRPLRLPFFFYLFDGGVLLFLFSACTSAYASFAHRRRWPEGPGSAR